MNIRMQALLMSAARAGIGVASIAAPTQAAAIAGYPAAHDNPTARLMARFFGVREVLMAWLVVDAFRRSKTPPASVFVAQAAVDAADIVVQSIPLVRREGITRGAAGGVFVAAGAAVMWLDLARRARVSGGCR